MPDNALPIVFRANRDIFIDPETQGLVRQKISSAEYQRLCTKPDSLPIDLNEDGEADQVEGFVTAESPHQLQIVVRDGREPTRFLAGLFDGEGPFRPDEVLQEIPRRQGPLCVADVNDDAFLDILWKGEALLNQIPKRRQSVGSRLDGDFSDDWNYLTRRLEHYRKKFGRRVRTSLLVEEEEGGQHWRLQLQTDGKTFLLPAFPDPTRNPYEPASMLGREDPEELLHRRLFGRGWGVALRFGAFVPYTFRVLGNTSPIGFVAGAEWFYRWRHLGLSLEYDIGQAGIFPEELREVEAGDPISKLPINEPLPMLLRFQNVSATPFLHATFFGASFHTDLLAGVGAFYERGNVRKKRFEIVPNFADPQGSYVSVEKSGESYQAAGVRGRLGAILQKGAFQAGLEALLDLGLPWNGNGVESFSGTLLRGILSLSVGYRHF